MSRREKPRSPQNEPAPETEIGLRRFLRGHWKAAAGAAGIAAIIALGVHFLTDGQLWAGGSDGPALPKAAIVDQLSLTAANPDFTSNARRELEEAGYEVYYYPGEQVTVDFYRTLPTRDFDLILLRAHSGYDPAADAVGLFTGEPYEKDKYPHQGVGYAAYYEAAPPVFGIGPEFIESTMEGDFGGATIVMMGCDGLASVATAEALVEKGAEAVVSWDGQVLAPHTDLATEHLLKHLLEDELRLPEALKRTMSEVGPDPTYNSKLLLYQ